MQEHELYQARLNFLSYIISEQATTNKLITQLEKRIINLETVIDLLKHNRSMINTELHSVPLKIRKQLEK